MPSDEAMKAAYEVAQSLLVTIEQLQGTDLSRQVDFGEIQVQYAQIIDTYMQPKWIRVEDGLPEINVEVLVAYEAYGDVCFKVTHRYANVDFGFHKGWLGGVRPTHWMPLPPPPKEGS